MHDLTPLYEAMRARGLTPPTNLIPGKFLRFPANEQSGDKAGWCLLFPDYQGAVFGDHRSGFKQVWQSMREKSMSAAERKELAKRVAKAKAEAEAIRDSEYSSATIRAQEIWGSAPSAMTSHPYLVKKRIQPFEVRQYKGRLVIPVYANDGALQSIQYIDTKGEKRFLPGGKMQAGRYWLRKPGDVIYLGEGFATMATIAEAIPNAGVVCCFSAASLLRTAKDVRATYPRASLVIAGDDDRHTEGNPGRTKAEEAAQASGASAVFPPFDDDEAGSDFNDLLVAHGEDAVRRVLATPPELAETVRPSLRLDNGKLPDALETVIARLSEDHIVFDGGGFLLAIDSIGNPFQISPPWLSTTIEKAFIVQKFDARTGDYVPAKVPLEFGQRIMAARDMWTFRRLEAVTTHRVVRTDGTVISKHGYDDQTGIYLYHPEGDWEPIPDDLETAVSVLWHALGLMPYVSAADAGAALALMLTAVQRPVLPLCPAFITSATNYGAGKTIMGEVACILAGTEPAATTFGKSPEEQEKSVLATLLSGRPVALVDNVSGSIGGDHLAACLTACRYRARILGQSAQSDVSTRVLWIFTGINIGPAADLTRRSITARLDPGVERPELRDFPFHPVKWARTHAAEMQAAALKIMQSATMHQQPALGSFDEWDKTVRAAVLHVIASGAAPCSMADPLDVMTRERTEDPEIEMLGALLLSWHALKGERLVTIKDLVETGTLATDTDLLGALDAVAGDGRGNINSRRLGKYLSRHEKKIVYGLHAVKGRESRLGVLWKVTSAGLGGIEGFSSSNMEKCHIDTNDT